MAYDGRRELAATCRREMTLSLPIVVDEMDDRVERLYAGWPERLFVIGVDGRLKYVGRQGPWGFQPHEVERWLRRNLPPRSA